MKSRFVVLFAILGAMGTFAFGPAPVYAAPTAPTVSLSGELIQVADARGPGFAAVRTPDKEFVPVEASAVKELKPGSAVTLNVLVPAKVRSVAATNSTLTVRGPNGKVTSTPLGIRDLAAASDGTPEPATSDLGRATAAYAVSTGQPLAVTVVVSAADPVMSYTPATRHLYVAIVTPQGAPTPTPTPATPAQIQTQVTNASNYWSTVSGGGVKLDIAIVTQPYVSAFSCSDNPFSMWNEAAGKTGFPDTANTSVVVELPPGISSSPTSNCGYGLGTIGANVNDSGLLYVSDNVFPVLAHELGHNMSLQHADALQCPSASDSAFDGTNWTGSGCTEAAYGDGDDVMSASPPDFAPFLSSPQSLRTGIIPISAATVISTNGTTNVTLNALGSRSGVRTAEVVDPTNNVTYYVEYRSATAPDTANVYGDAVGVRVLRFNPTTGATVVLDPTPPGTTSGDADATLHPNSTFISSSGAVRVTTVSTTATTASVSITRATTPSRLDFTGDGRADVHAINSSGALLLYRGNGLGGFTGAGTGIGSGWSGFTKVFSPGDFTGDGRADILAITSSGALFLYRGNGLGGFTGAGTQIATGWAFVKVF